jgi:hypothetical protein
VNGGCTEFDASKKLLTMTENCHRLLPFVCKKGELKEIVIEKPVVAVR